VVIERDGSEQGQWSRLVRRCRWWVTEMSDDDAVEVPQIVRPDEAAALVAAYVQAQHAELVIQWLLAHADIPAGVTEPVAGVDARARPTVRVLLHTREHAHLLRIIAAIRSVIEPRPIDAA